LFLQPILAEHLVKYGFAHHYFLPSKTPSNLCFLFIKLLLRSVQTDFTKCVSLGVLQPVVYYQSRPKLNSHSGTSISIQFFQDQKNGRGFKNHQTNKQTTQQKHMNTGEHP